MNNKNLATICLLGQVSNHKHQLDLRQEITKTRESLHENCTEENHREIITGKSN